MRHCCITFIFAVSFISAVWLHGDERFIFPQIGDTDQPGTTVAAACMLMEWVFFLPGDLLISLAAHADRLQEATGITTAAYGGRVSGLLSVLGWIAILQAAGWWLALPFRLVLRLGDPLRRPD